MTERLLQQKVIKFCANEAIMCAKVAAVGRAGWPDLVCIANGRTLWIELKSPKGTGRLSPLQKATHEKMRLHGAEVLVGHDYETITAVIRARLIP